MRQPQNQRRNYAPPPSRTSCHHSHATRWHGVRWYRPPFKMTELKYSRGGTEKGKISGPIPSGAVLASEYVTVVNASLGWGSIYSSVYGAGGSASGSANGYSIHAAGQRYITAILTNESGTVGKIRRNSYSFERSVFQLAGTLASNRATRKLRIAGVSLM